MLSEQFFLRKQTRNYEEGPISREKGELVEESDTNIHILQRYYIDDQSLKIYKGPEDWYADTEILLYYIGNLEK